MNYKLTSKGLYKKIIEFFVKRSSNDEFNGYLTLELDNSWPMKSNIYFGRWCQNHFILPQNRASWPLGPGKFEWMKSTWSPIWHALDNILWSIGFCIKLTLKKTYSLCFTIKPWFLHKLRARIKPWFRYYHYSCLSFTANNGSAAGPTNKYGIFI